MEETIQSTPIVDEETSTWQEVGYSAPLARLCVGLEQLPEKDYIPLQTKRIVERLKTSKRVEDFDDLATEDLERYRNVITRDLPRYYQEVTTMIRNLSRARTIVSDDDFI